MGIIIGADLVPTESNFDLFEKAELNTLFGNELLKLVSTADFRIFNLETPITDLKTPIKKCGPALVAPERVITGIKALGVNLLTVANNHILDHGEQGFNKTLQLLSENNIDYVGAGGNLQEAIKPYLFEFGGKKIGVYSCAEHEFSIATQEKCGANPFDALESVDHVAELKKQCDYVIVLYHGGKEHYRYPSPNLQKVCRKLVDKGANLVICQHSHCIGCEEKYNNGLIVYGQGNFIFDHSESEFWQTGMLIEIDNDFGVKYIPIVKKENVVRLAESDAADEILKGFRARSQEILSEDTLKEKYEILSKQTVESYLWRFSEKKRGLLFKVIDKATNHRYGKWYLKKKYAKNKLLAIQNTIECEAHRELVLNGLKER